MDGMRIGRGVAIERNSLRAGWDDRRRGDDQAGKEKMDCQATGSRKRGSAEMRR